MYELVYLYHLEEAFRRQGYQVHRVNSWTAYDFISDTATTAAFDTVLAQDPVWLELAFSSDSARHGLYSLPASQAQVLLYSEKRNWLQLEYSDCFIAARPNSSLVLKAFEALETLVSTGTHPLAARLGILARNEDTAVDYLRNGLSDVINLVVF